MVVTFHDYEEGDVFKVRIREGDPLGGPVGDQPGPAWTMKDGDEVIACMGVKHAGGGIGNLWMFASDDVRGHGLAMARFGRKALDVLIRVMKYHRIQTVIRADRPEYERWAKLFGFEFEGRLRKATPGKDDVLMYARVE